MRSSIAPADLLVHDFNQHLGWLAVAGVSITILVLVYYMKGVQVYLLDFAICQPPDSLKIPHDLFMVRCWLLSIAYILN